ncbi:MAG: hypothetical protein CMK78_11440 [Pseudomonadales bacterium]|nr:hypothetical protein [Pseudomonadales bacterium]
MKTHYMPYQYETEDIERAPCGTWLGEDSGVTGILEIVTCAKCIKKSAKILQSAKTQEEAILAQMGSMADFMRRKQAQ